MNGGDIWLRIFYLWDRATGRFRRCRVEDGYCLTHHVSHGDGSAGG